MGSRYMIIILGTYNGVSDDLNYIAHADYGVNYVDGNGIFLGTFYSEYNTEEIYKLIVHIPAFLLFDITDGSTNIVNLPSKYFKGLFPEYEDIMDMLDTNFGKNQTKKEKNVVIEEYDNVDDILDKLSRNKYDRSCLTEKEIDILDNQSN